MNIISAHPDVTSNAEKGFGRPLVSVVVPAFNHEAFVEQAIESVLCQSYPNIELIVVDDGSTDGTWTVIERLHRQHAPSHKFEIFRKANEGPCKTFNFGVRKSSGSLVCILASDDWFAPDKIARQVALFEEAGDGVGLVHSSAFAVFDDGRRVDMRGQYVPAEGTPLHGLLSLDVRAIAPSMMFRRDVFDAVSGFDETLSTEDVDFFAAIVAAGYELRYDPRPLMYKRAVEGSLGGNIEACFESHFRILEKHKANLSQAEFDRIRGRLVRQEGRAWLTRLEIRQAARCYGSQARSERSILPWIEFGGWLSRQLMLRLLPGPAHHALRRMRYLSTGLHWP